MKMVIITVLYMNPKIGGDIEDIKKINQISTDENYNVWGETYSDWKLWKISYFRQDWVHSGWYGHRWRLDISEKINSEFEDIAITIILKKENRETELKSIYYRWVLK